MKDVKKSHLLISIFGAGRSFQQLVVRSWRAGSLGQREEAKTWQQIMEEERILTSAQLKQILGGSRIILLESVEKFSPTIGASHVEKHSATRELGQPCTFWKRKLDVFSTDLDVFIFLK